MGNRILFLRRLLIILLCCAPYISAQDRLPETFRFGVFSLFNPTHLIIRPLKNHVVLLTVSKSSIPVDSEVQVTAVGEVLRITADSHPYKAESLLITSRDGGPTEFVLAVPGKISRIFRGTLEIAPLHRRLQATVVIDSEVAVASAVSAEAPPGAPMEALKAQAVVARSFYLGSHNRHQDFDFCDTTHCQLLKEPPRTDEPAYLAAQQTRGLTLHYRGEIIAAMFSASCGGHTRTLADVGIVTEGYPYYSVEDSYCDRNARRWRARLSSPEAQALAQSHSEHDRLALGRKIGWNVVPGNNYVVQNEADAVNFEGKGSGHGLGLCQQGATAMAGDGASFREILAHYFPNTIVSE